MTVEFLWWAGCPSHPDALDRLRQVLEDEGVGAAVDVVEITSEEQAEQERFTGSPTIRIGGEDVVPPDDEEPFGLTCRVYRLRDGRVSAVPDAQDIREAVRRAA